MEISWEQSEKLLAVVIKMPMLSGFSLGEKETDLEWIQEDP